jgi:putative transcriptional regulator
LKIEKQTSLLSNFGPWPWLTNGCIAIAVVIAIVVLVQAPVAMAGSGGANAQSFFLVASRNMSDPVFQESVILMLPPDEPPLVAGVIINKPTDVTLGNLLRQPVAPENRNQKVYFGGPVDITVPLLVIRTARPPKPAIRLCSDVYAIIDAHSISDVLKDSRSGNDARLFLGRAQWAQEQLRGELLEGAWSVVPLRTDLIFEHDSAKVWPILSQHEHVREIDTCGATTEGPMSVSMCSGANGW